MKQRAHLCGGTPPSGSGGIAFPLLMHPERMAISRAPTRWDSEHAEVQQCVDRVGAADTGHRYWDANRLTSGVASRGNFAHRRWCAKCPGFFSDQLSDQRTRNSTRKDPPIVASKGPGQFPEQRIAEAAWRNTVPTDQYSSPSTLRSIIFDGDTVTRND